MNTEKKPRRQVRFPGIVTDAETLGCNYRSLYRVLTGEWKIPGLKSRYEALKAKQAAEKQAGEQKEQVAA